MGELRARKATPSLADPLTPHGRPSAAHGMRAAQYLAATDLMYPLAAFAVRNLVLVSTLKAV
jgi:hypothetical protein